MDLHTIATRVASVESTAGSVDHGPLLQKWVNDLFQSNTRQDGGVFSGPDGTEFRVSWDGYDLELYPRYGTHAKPLAVLRTSVKSL